MVTLKASVESALDNVKAKIAGVGSFMLLAKIKVSQGYATEFQESLKKVSDIANSEREPGTKTYRVTRGLKEDDHTFIVIEEYFDLESLVAHASSEEFKTLSVYDNIDEISLEVLKEF